MHAQLLVNALASGAGYALVAVSFGLIYRVVHFFHIAHGAVYTLAAYCALVCVTILGWPLAAAAVVAVVAAAGIGIGLELLIYRPLRRRNSSDAALLLASLGLLIVLQNVVSLVFGDETRSMRHGDVAAGIEVIGARITIVQLTILLVSPILTGALWAWLRFGRYGKYVRAVADDPKLSTIVGVPADRVFVVVFAVGSALVAVIAVLNGLDTDLTPLMGFRVILMGIVAAIIGGIGSIPGAFLGGMVIGVLESWGAWVLPSQWQDTTVFVVLVVFLLVRPQGVLGRPLRKGSI